MDNPTWIHPFGPSLEKTVESTFGRIQKPFAEVQSIINEVQDQDQREVMVGLAISTLLATSRVSTEFLVAGLDAVQTEALVSYQQTLIDLVPRENLVTPVVGGLRR